MAEEPGSPRGKKIDVSDFDNFSEDDNDKSWFTSLTKEAKYTPTNNYKPWSPLLPYSPFENLDFYHNFSSPEQSPSTEKKKHINYSPTNNYKYDKQPWSPSMPYSQYKNMDFDHNYSSRERSPPKEEKKDIEYTKTIKRSTKTTTVATKILLDDAHNGFKNGNFVCSPFSLEILLGMIAAGAKGETLKQLLEFLGHETMDQLHSESPSMKFLGQISDLNSDGSLVVGLANGIWVDKKLDPINSCYQDVLKTVYNTHAKYVDLDNKHDQAVKEINSWVNKETRGLIPTIVDNELSQNVVMVLANALYFQRAWRTPFKTHMTKSEDFHLISGETVSVPFMTSYEEEFQYGSFEDFKILKMPYKTKVQSDRDRWFKFSMYILLPDKINGLLDLLELFHSNHALFNGYFDLHNRKLDKLQIPKFKISYNFEVQNVMKEMGLVLPFQPMNKDFNEILSSGSPFKDTLSVSEIFQKSFIEIDESGTQAASVPWARPIFYCKPPPPANFVADHPFMFMIREDSSRAVLFVGVVLNPV